MTTRENWPDIEELWCEDTPELLSCHVCLKPLGSEPVFRTCRIGTLDASCAERKPTKCVRAAGEEILLFDRHMDCRSGFDYVAISHVWDPQIADTQDRGRSSQRNIDIQQRLFASVIQVIRGLKDHFDAEVEIWHDYVSVPQWAGRLKARILTVMPRIFGEACCTLVHLEDVSIEMVDKLYGGNSSQERIDGITGICNAKWFKRVWTIMEYVRSRRVKVMIRGYQVYEGVNDVFLAKLHDVWTREVDIHQGNVHDVETVAEFLTNTVPWALGPLQAARRLESVDFGLGYAILSRRGCRTPSDFFHALVGILKTTLTEPIKGDRTQAMLQIAENCVRRGDYSPLLTTPSPILVWQNRHLTRASKYYAVHTFGLGYRVSDPRFYDNSVSGTDSLTLILENIGITKFFAHTDHMGSRLDEFYQIMQAVYSFTGANVDDFVTTVGANLYNQTDDAISLALSDRERRQAIQEALQGLANSPPLPWQDRETKPAHRIASAMGLFDKTTRNSNVPPLSFLREHGGTIHIWPSMYLIAVTCETCHRTSIFWAGLYKPPVEIYGAIAYRIPGLEYQYSRQNGVGILLKNGAIVGRLLWASHSCQCLQMETVDLSLGSLPLPNPWDSLSQTVETVPDT